MRQAVNKLTIGSGVGVAQQLGAWVDGSVLYFGLALHITGTSLLTCALYPTPCRVQKPISDKYEPIEAPSISYLFAILFPYFSCIRYVPYSQMSCMLLKGGQGNLLVERGALSARVL